MNHQLALTIQLNQQTTLADFCWGENYQLKLQIETLLTAPFERFIYIWGNSGSGKTHILQGCCHAINRLGSASYLPLALLKPWGPDCLEGFEEQSLIAIDNLEVIAGNPMWEEALFHFYNRLRDNNHTIVIIASQQPPTLNAIQLADLRSRLAWGMVYQINELADEAKIKVLQQQALKRGFELPIKVALFILKRCARNMHELFHLLERLDQASLAAQRKLTIPFVKTILNF